MSRSQSAVVASYEFGAPTGVLITDAAAQVLKFRTKKQDGGKMDIRVSNVSETSGDITVSLRVSADGISYADTSAASNGQAVASVAIPAGTHRDFTVVIRPGTDNYFALSAIGAKRGVLQIRESHFDLVQV